MKTNKLPPIHPGEILREEFMKPRGLSQNALARALNVPPRRSTRSCLKSAASRRTPPCGWRAILALARKCGPACRPITTCAWRATKRKGNRARGGTAGRIAHGFGVNHSTRPQGQLVLDNAARPCKS